MTRFSQLGVSKRLHDAHFALIPTDFSHALAFPFSEVLFSCLTSSTTTTKEKVTGVEGL